MALNKDFKDYSYNLGRTVAVVEIINGLRQTFASDVANNAKDKLPYQLTEALKKHNWTNARIGMELGMDADEVLRLKQITGLAEAFKDEEFSKSWEPVYEDEPTKEELWQN